MTTSPEVQLTAKEVRILEIASYTENIRIYEKLLTTLDGNWDKDLVQFKGMESQDAARQCPLDRLDRLAVLQQYDQATNLLKTEIVECAKAKAILAIMD